NASVLDCPSTRPGTYSVRVTATDSLGWSASAEANLTVAVAPPGTGGPGPKGSGPLSDAPFLEGFAASAVLFALVASALLARSSARRRESERLARELEEGAASAPPDLLESR
ncbi:MAG TPA: PKD domain-containing protein, partial [Thermoplasmata archaeon]|nr:PKD domain-containing protein [Thermoplasmata archaeon]